MRSISIPWSSLFRRSLKVISTFFTSFLAWALLLYNIWAHCTCKLLDWGFTSFVANDSLTHTLISREECTDLATARPLLLEKEYELNLDIKKEGDKNKQKRLWPISFVQKLQIRKIYVFCTITLQHLSYRLRHALQNKKKTTAATAQVPIFWKVLRTFRAWNASRQIEIHLFWKAGLLTYFLIYEKPKGLRSLMAENLGVAKI